MPSATPEYAIAITGAGAVGASLALGLAAPGVRIALIDADPGDLPGVYDDRAYALSWTSRQFLGLLGIWPDLQRRAAPICRVRVSEWRRPPPLWLEARNAGVEALGYTLSAHTLGETLFSRLATKPDIHYLRGTRVEQAVDRGECVELKLHGGANLGAIRARLAIAADGAESTLRQQSAIESTRSEYGQSALITTLQPGFPPNRTAFEIFTDHGVIAVLPGLGCCHVIWSAGSDRIQQLLDASDDTLRSALQRYLGQHLGRLGRLGPRAGYPLALHRAQRHVHGRIVLAGNAAQTLHPIGAQGLNLGMRDAVELISRVAGCDDPGDAALLQAYAEARRDDQRHTVAMSDLLARAGALPLRSLRAAGMAGLALAPGLRRRFLNRALGRDALRSGAA